MSLEPGNFHQTEQTPKADLADLKTELRGLLTGGVKVDLIAQRIYNFVKDSGNKGLRPEAFACALAKHLASKWSFTPSANSPIDRLIEYRPEELDAVVSASFRDEIPLLAKAIARLPKRKPRTKPRTDKERQKKIQVAKNRYDLSRSFRSGRGGLIESEFSKTPAAINPLETSYSGLGLSDLVPRPAVPTELPGGPCLDGLFRGRNVQMTKGTYSLENLFGRSRKMLPTALPHRRMGQKILYGHRAVLKCMHTLLKEAGRRDPWLQDASIRRKVLQGVAARAQRVATPKIAAAFDAALSNYLR